MRVISDNEATQLLREIFNLQVPVAFAVVKRTYRMLSKKTHPDATGGSDESFKALNNAFEQLSDLYVQQSHIFDATENKEDAEGIQLPTVTTDGTPLTDLGKGVKFQENGIECDGCGGKGYNLQAVLGYRMKTCPDCLGQGRVPKEYTCNACGGSGKFTQAKSRKVVDCRRCNGSGKFKHPRHETFCRRCFGYGRVQDDKPNHYVAIKCYKCGGVGETIILNPVLRNGALVG